MSLLKKLGPLAGLAGLAAIIGTGGAAAPAVAAAEGAGAAGLGAGATGLTLGGAGAAAGMGGGTGLLGTLGGTTATTAGLGGGTGLIGSLPTLGAVEAAPVLAAGATPIQGGYFDGATPDGLLAANTPKPSGGLMDSFKGAMDQVKPYADAAGNASKVMGQFQNAPVNAPQPGSKTDGGAASAQLFNSIQQGDLQRIQEEMAKRQKLNGLFGGGNGWTA